MPYKWFPFYIGIVQKLHNTNIQNPNPKICDQSPTFQVREVFASSKVAKVRNIIFETELQKLIYLIGEPSVRNT